MHLENTSAKLKNILQVMLPIFITQITIMGMSVADTVMSGHAGAESLAGVAIAGNIWMPVFTGLNGILMALTPIVAQFLGAGKREAISGIEAQSEVVAQGGQYWAQVLAFGQSLGKLNPTEVGILGVCAQVPTKIPSEKQSLAALKVADRLEQFY